MSSSATIVNDGQIGDCVQQLSSSTSGVPSNTTSTQVIVSPSNATTTQTSRRHHENRKSLPGSISLVRADGRPSSSEANANPPRSRKTAPRRFVENDMTTAIRAISDSPLVHGNFNVSFSPTGRHQGSRSRNTGWSRAYEGPGSSSARASKEPGISSKTVDREGTGVTEGDLKSAEDISGTQLLRDLGNHPSVFARAALSSTTTQASKSHQGNRKIIRGSTGLARADGQPALSEANVNPIRSRITTPRYNYENGDCVQQPSSSTSGVLVTSGRHQANKKRSHGSTSLARVDGQLSSSEANANPTRPKKATPEYDWENGDCVQQPSSSTSGVPVVSGRHQGNRKRSRRSSSLVRADGQPSSSANPTRSKRTTPRQVIEDDITPAERAISESPLVRGTSGVPLTPTRRGQGSRRKNASSSRSYKGPGSRSARAVGQPGVSSETAGREDTGVAEGDLIPTERAIYGTQLIRNLRKHPSVYARTGQNPSSKGLSFRGAWNTAIELYRAAHDQYKQLFVAAGFGDFLKIEPVELPQGYLIALTERWFAETNTLHLPCCELGPTPVDWTMITGLRFGGRCINLDPNYEKEKVRVLLGVGRKNIFKGKRICLSKIKPDESEVTAVPPNREVKERIFRRLFLYVIGSCFFGNNQSVIHYEFVQFLEDIDAVRAYNWGAITFAAFLAGLRKKVNTEIGSFTAFWQFLPFWAFEYLNISRPELADENAFPRAMRWKFPSNVGTLDNSELTASRCQLDYVDHESQVTWEPYLPRLDGILYSVTLAKRRVRFMGIYDWEYYLGERCRRQLGLPYLVPSNPP